MAAAIVAVVAIFRATFGADTDPARRVQLGRFWLMFRLMIGGTDPRLFCSAALAFRCFRFGFLCVFFVAHGCTLIEVGSDVARAYIMPLIGYCENSKMVPAANFVASGTAPGTAEFKTCSFESTYTSLADSLMNFTLDPGRRRMGVATLPEIATLGIRSPIQPLPGYRLVPV